MRLLVALTVLLLTACGSSTPDAGDDDALQPGAEPLGELAVEQDAGDGSPPQRWSLVCGSEPSGDGGDHPDVRGACDTLRAATDPFAPLPDDQICTEQYGGPQTARVTGTWRGEPVDLELSRTDGCRIAQWEALGPLLPGPVGVTPPQ